MSDIEDSVKYEVYNDEFHNGDGQFLEQESEESLINKENIELKNVRKFYNLIFSN